MGSWVDSLTMDLDGTYTLSECWIMNLGLKVQQLYNFYITSAAAGSWLFFFFFLFWLSRLKAEVSKTSPNMF